MCLFNFVFVYRILIVGGIGVFFIGEMFINYFYVIVFDFSFFYLFRKGEAFFV